MSRTRRHLTFVLGAALAVMPVLAVAQPGRGAPDRPAPGAGPGPGIRGPRGGVSHLLDARRELDLTPRQVAQLDSLERLQYAEHKAFMERVRPVRDSIAQRARGGQRTPALRDSLQAQARARQEAMRPQLEQLRQRDSVRNAAAERVLNDAQRTKLREMQAERRGYERGIREGRGQSGGQVGPQGGPRGGMMGGQGARGGRGGMRGPQGGEFGPQGGMRGPQGPGAPGGRMGPPQRPPLEQEPDDR